MTTYPSELTFNAFLQYAPRGLTPTSQMSRTVTYKIKTDGFMGHTRIIAHAARRVAEQISQYPLLQTCFGAQVTLVPVPRSSPRRAGFLWPAERICQALLAEGLGHDIQRCLERTRPIQRAAMAPAGQRPNPPDHHDSIQVHVPETQLRPTRLVLIDDVITRGSTFVGLYPGLQAAYPNATIHCFALVRTISVGEVDTILAPTSGTITYRDGHLVRQP